MYTMVTTRPNLAYTIRVVSRYMSNPRWKHWEAIKNIFRYRKGTEDVQLTFGSEDLAEVEGYIDSDYASNMDN